MIIIVKKISQCGDHFIFTYDCPVCKTTHFETNDSRKNKICQCGFKMCEVIFDTSDHSFNLVAGTIRKCRFSVKKIRAMYILQEEKCAYCIKSLNNNYHVEHIVPLCAGGTNADSNLCLACPSCNLIAGAKVFPSFIEKQRYILDIKYKRKLI